MKIGLVVKLSPRFFTKTQHVIIETQSKIFSGLSVNSETVANDQDHSSKLMHVSSHWKGS